MLVADEQSRRLGFFSRVGFYHQFVALVFQSPCLSFSFNQSLILLPATNKNGFCGLLEISSVHIRWRLSFGQKCHGQAYGRWLEWPVPSWLVRSLDIILVTPQKPISK